MKTRKKIRVLDRLARHLRWTTRHRRLSLYWTAAIIGLLLPWLSSFSTDAHLSCTVNSIYDGDTMRLTCEGKRIKVRLYCIDAPELSQRPWGKESRDYLRAITPDQVTVIARAKDRYGRTVGEVITADEDQENLNLAMVRSGQAAVYPKYCNDRPYFQAEAEAKKLQSGIWEKPGTHQRSWEWRRRRQ